MAPGPVDATCHEPVWRPDVLTGVSGVEDAVDDRDFMRNSLKDAAGL